jgi:hypothetical protein
MQLYRYETVVTCKGVSPILLEIPIHRETPSCYVGHWGSREKFILKSQEGKRYAYLTPELAWDSYRKRCSRRRWHLLRQLKDMDSLFDSQGWEKESYHEHTVQWFD